VRISLFSYRPRIVCDVSKLSILPGDVIAVKWPRDAPMHTEAAMVMAQQVKAAFPRNVVLVLAPGIEVESVFGERVNYADLGVEDPWADQPAGGGSDDLEGWV
jgi:hypothetical protein